MPSVNCFLPHQDPDVYTPYSEGGTYRRETDMEMVVEQNLFFQLQWLVAGNLDPLPEEFYPTVEMMEFHWNLSPSLLESFLQIECPLKAEELYTEEFKYSKRLTMLDYSAVHDRLTEILCPYVTTPGHSFDMRISLDCEDDSYLFRSIDQYRRNRRVWRNDEEGVVWEDSMDLLTKKLNKMVLGIINCNNDNGAMGTVSFNLGVPSPSEIEHLERIFPKVVKRNQVCYTLSERGNK